MDDKVCTFFNEIQKCLYRLNNLLVGSERFLNQLYKEMGDLVSEEENKAESETKSVIKNYEKIFHYFSVKFDKLKVKLIRENCQIFMYGKVSAGKSKIINAILGEEIFHSASSHTTSCFVKICKSPDEYHYIEYGNNKEIFNHLDNLKNKINEISTEFGTNKYKLKTNELLSVYLNIPNNKILTSNIEIIDCPGSANREKITDCIKDKGLNANIFIFVLNNGLTEDDKSFFQYQWDNSSRPIIFFLVNKWDQAYCDGDQIAANSKKKITNELMEFLTNQIRLPDSERENRIFFLSAVQMCKKRNIGNGTSTVSDHHKEDNCLEFENFEKSLAQFINAFNDEKRKYQNELVQLKEEIIRDTNQFEIDLKEKIYIVNIQHFEEYLKDIETSSRSQVNKIETVKENTEIESDAVKASISEIETDLKQYKNKSVKKKLKKFMCEQEHPILKLKIEVDEYISTEIDKYEKFTKIYKALRKENVKLTEMMKMEIKLTDVTIWEKFRITINDILTFFKNIIEEGSDKKYAEEEPKFKENKEKFNLAVQEFQENMTTNVNALIEYMETEIGKIINQLQLKIKVYNELSKNIENLFNINE